LDGTWSHDNGSDEWDGSGIGGEFGDGNRPGGLSALEEGGVKFIRIQDTGDPRDYGYADPGSNRKVYLGHDMSAHGATDTQMDDGVTLSFRARVPVPGKTVHPLDPLHRDGQQANGLQPYPAGGDGYVTSDGGKGNFVIKQAAGGAIAFSLTTATDTPGGDPSVSVANFNGLTMNEFNGNQISGNVNFGQGTGTNVIAFDPTEWHEFWIVLRKDPANVGTHQGFIYMDGSLTPTVFKITAGTGSDYSGITYLAIGMTATPQNAALDIDFVAYKLGAFFPSGAVENLPPEILAVSPAPGTTFHPAANGVSFQATTVGNNTLPPEGFKLILNGQDVSAGLNVTGTDQARTVTYTGLADNLVYRGQIIVADQAGRAATNDLRFDTFSAQASVVIEAEDYNFASGQFIDNPSPQGYLEKVGTPGVDFFDTTDFPTGGANYFYRSADPVGTQVSLDGPRQQYVNNLLQEIQVALLQPGEWLNYTRTFPAGTYNVHLRAATTVAQPVRLELVTGDRTQPGQTTRFIGAFAVPRTGSVNAFDYATLTDLNGAPLVLNLSGVKTFRLAIEQANNNLNLNYLVFAPTPAATGPRLPQVVAVPGKDAAGVSPDTGIDILILDGDTQAVAGSVRLTFDGADVTAAATVTDTAEGVSVHYQPPTILTPGSLHQVAVSVADNATPPNQQNFAWSFTVANLPVLPAAWATPPGSGRNPGINVKIRKARNDAPDALFPNTFARAEAHLRDEILDPNTGTPFFNEAGGPNGDGLYTEPGAINYDQLGEIGAGEGRFVPDTGFPYLDLVDNNYISMEATAYLELAAGVYRFVVASDDAFRVSVGPTFTEATLVLGAFEGGRSTAESPFDFVVQAPGLYAFRLIYTEGTGGADVEWFAVDRRTGLAALINDPNAPSAIKAFTAREGSPTVGPNPVRIGAPTVSGGNLQFSFPTEAGFQYIVEFKDALSDAQWQALAPQAGTGGPLSFSAPVSGASRFYRVRAQ
jgi:hypothetical protein